MTTEQILMMIFTAVLSFLSGRAQIMANRHDEATARKEAQFQQLIEQQKEFADWQEKIASQVAELDKNLNNISHCADRLKEGGLILLRDRIIQSCRIFIERGSITMTARNNIREMYKVYHDEFDGNGDGEYYFKWMMKLPIDADVPLVSHFECGGKHEND